MLSLSLSSSTDELFININGNPSANATCKHNDMFFADGFVGSVNSVDGFSEHKIDSVSYTQETYEPLTGYRLLIVNPSKR